MEDFDKYSALRLAEELASVAKTSAHAKATNYEIIASTLREKLSAETAQFKAYFLALLADKEFTRIIETVSKIDKSFKRAHPYQNPPARRGRFSASSSPRIVCYRCGKPGHKVPQCWSTRRPPSRVRPDRSTLPPQ